MPYCSQCGVEVTSDTEFCPLCKTQVQQIGMVQTNGDKKYPDEPVLPPLHIPSNKLRLLIWELVSVVIISAVLIILFIDLTLNKTITWSRFPLASLLLTWLLTTFPLTFFEIPLMIVVGEVTSLMIFLGLLDLFINGKLMWFYQVAIPLIVLLVIVIAAIVLLSIRSKKKGTNIAGFILIGLGLIGTGLDIIIMSAINNAFTISWSVFVIIPCFLIGFFLVYFHYRLSKVINFKKWFQV